MIRIYFRVSTDKQDYEMQLHGINGFLDTIQVKLEDCMIYQDFGLSGTTTARPEYQKLLSEIKEGDTLLAYEFSRLWRDMEEQSRATKMLIALGVKIVSPIDGSINNLEDSLSADIKGVINQHEARRVKRRSKEGIEALQAKVAQGLEVWHGRGKDKQKRKTDGYRKEQERRRLLKSQNKL